MANAKDLFRQNFIEYASYVIKDRAIPDIEDGLKPVQRRILHTMIETDDGRFNKVANVVGSTMKYHPHGDASIYTALVNLANYDLFIDKQGNYGNFMTGDGPAAARYIECRLLPFAKKVLYNPEITEYVESYDGRNKEPVVFPAKIPVVLIQGTEGIAVGMSTKILPHNALEVIDAQIAAIRGEEFQLFPDFPGGGIMDISDYQDGLGSVAVRAKLDTSNAKKIIIEELPFGVDSEKMIKSIEEAIKKGRLKIQSVSDFTADKVNIEISLAKGTYTKDVVDALYAYTLCEQKISVNCLVIRDKLPHVCTVSDVIRYHADHIIEVSKKELEVQRGHLFDKLHTRTLERIFIEERIYKRIEQKRTQEAVVQAIRTGFEPYVDQLVREITDDDIDHLLKIPIRRISLFDIEKNKEEIDQINADIRQVDYDLTHLDEYSIRTLNGIKADLDNEDHQRKTVIADFNMVDVRDVAKRDFDLRYDGMTGYLGTNVKTGNVLFKVSEFDKILIIQKNGTYYCANVSDRLFVGKDISYCGLADKESLEDLVFTVIYLDKKTKVTYIKRCKLSGFILNKPYELLPDPENNLLKKLSVLPNAEVTVTYKGPTRVKESTFLFSDFLVKGAKAGGVTITKKDIASIRIKPCKLVEGSKPETAASEEEDDEPEIETVAESDAETPETKVKPESKATRKQSDDDMPGLFDDV
ncbi:MAG: DNA topoisomerase IV subunit A [Sphaerochaetaceae bacterium]|nr:DNA topoisomerase IV subunit A [Sphaerochaetaceae bacterium]